MNERKRLAKEINRGCFIRGIVGFALFIPYGIAYAIICNTGNSPLIVMGLFLGFILLFLVGARAGKYSIVADIMSSRALVGKEISNDPIKEGLERYKKYGYRKFKAQSRSCGEILYGLTRGAMEIGELMEHVPVLQYVAATYKKIVRRAHDNTAKLIVTYQLGIYEEGDDDMINDLITYFVQDGKKFLLRTVKTEVKGYILGWVWYGVSAVLVLAFLATKSIVALILLVPVLFLAAAWGAIISSRGDFNTLCEYIEYVQTHELDTVLRAKILTTFETGDRMLNIRDAVYNPTNGNVERAIHSTGALINQVEEKLENR
ncbi:hypothetical protein SAMN02910298_02267 [Pseudobutyrivibrio sp. YE44]|uniref:hypothetical protein n=1 Tax=Pseudobutyrivibrio sp. YE44 TaxID=1520802 RepID=UPI00088C96B9|nr:hypothetical protein [Pseudobutyrivibrio sp. YE44]SDB45266.1 hypothetical protein SAMN02910298_02267 [Pseudobutyrivibrio sp. YE44]